MAIFGKRNTAPSTPEVPVYEGYVEDGLAGIQTINAEATMESFQLSAGMYISDVIMEESVLEGTATPEVLMESFVKDTFAKLQAILEKLWAKVRAWFDKSKRFLQILFSTGAKFIEKFRKEIEEKTAAGFTYEGFHYTMKAGDDAWKGKEAELKKAITDAVGDIKGFTVADQKASIQGAEDTKDSYKHSEEQEAIIKSLGADNISDVLKGLKKAYRNGKDAKEEIKDFAANSKAELISLVADAKTNLSKLAAYQKGIDEDFARVITAIKGAKGAISGQKESENANRGKQITFAEHKIKMAQFALNVSTQLIAVNVDAIKEAAKGAEKALKSYLHYKPAKENFVAAGEGEEGSILESAMRFI